MSYSGIHFSRSLMLKSAKHIVCICSPSISPSILMQWKSTNTSRGQLHSHTVDSSHLHLLLLLRKLWLRMCHASALNSRGFHSKQNFSFRSSSLKLFLLFCVLFSKFPKPSFDSEVTILPSRNKNRTYRSRRRLFVDTSATRRLSTLGLLYSANAEDFEAVTRVTSWTI